MEHKSISLPKQARSRDSYLRLRTAAVDLLREEGPSALTVARVSARAGIAVGTLYGRVGSRSQLVRIVHQEELTRIIDDLHHRLAPLTRAPEDIDAVRSTIERLAQSLQEEAPVLTSLITMGQEDEMLRAHGREAWNKTRGVTIDALRRSMPSGRDRSSDTMEWVFEVAYALIARRLDIGGAHPRSPEPSSSFTQFVEHVTRTAMALFAYSAPGGADTPTTRSHDGASPPGAVH